MQDDIAVYRASGSGFPGCVTLLYTAVYTTAVEYASACLGWPELPAHGMTRGCWQLPKGCEQQRRAYL